MCGRFALTTPASELATLFGVTLEQGLAPRYNIAPTQSVTTVVERHGVRHAVLMRWGLVPSWAKDLSFGARLINARSETAHTKPSFRSAFKRRRCLVLADGFYEWRRQGAHKVPSLVQVAGGSPFAMAGLWEEWQHDTNNAIQSCTILTTRPNDTIAPIHNRMPVILPSEVWDQWLDPAEQNPRALQPLLVPWPAARTSIRPVVSWVNNARHEGPRCQHTPREPDA